MKTITVEELKMKLDQQEPLQLVMAMDRNAFNQAHIPGSLNFTSNLEATQNLDPSREVVVYCSNQFCRDSIQAYQELTHRGFDNVKRFSGGLEAWKEAGLALEGDITQSQKRIFQPKTFDFFAKQPRLASSLA